MEDKIKELEAANADLQKKLDQAKTQIQDLQNSSSEQGLLEEANAELQKKLAEQETRIQDYQKRDSDLDELTKVNADLQKKLEEAKASTGTGELFVSHDKKKYRVTAPFFQYDGQRIEAKSLAKNKEMVAELLGKGVGFLEEVK